MIVDGYNDLPDQFAGDVELALNTLRDRGVQHVLWVNLHEPSPSTPRRTPSWSLRRGAIPSSAFSTGTITPQGIRTGSRPTSSICARWVAIAIAPWIHQAIVDTLSPPAPPPAATLVVPAQRVVARVGVPFDAACAPAAEPHRSTGGRPAARCAGPASISCRRRADGHAAARAHVQLSRSQVTDAGGSRVTVTVAVNRRAARRPRSASHRASRCTRAADYRRPAGRSRADPAGAARP